MDWATVERNVLNETLSSVSLSFKDLRHVASVQEQLHLPHHGEDKGAGVCTVRCTKCEDLEERLNLLELRILRCEEDKNDVAVSSKLSYLEDDCRRHSSLLQHMSTSMASLHCEVDSIQSQFSRTRHEMKQELDAQLEALQDRNAIYVEAVNKSAVHAIASERSGKVSEILAELFGKMDAVDHRAETQSMLGRDDYGDLICLLRSHLSSAIETRVRHHINSINVQHLGRNAVDSKNRAETNLNLPIGLLDHRIQLLEGAVGAIKSSLSVAEITIQDLVENKNVVQNSIDETAAEMRQKIQNFTIFVEKIVENSTKIQSNYFENKLSGGTLAAKMMKNELSLMQRSLEALQDHLSEMQDAISDNTRKISTCREELASMTAKCKDLSTFDPCKFSGFRQNSFGSDTILDYKRSLTDIFYQRIKKYGICSDDYGNEAAVFAVADFGHPMPTGKESKILAIPDMKDSNWEETDYRSPGKKVDGAVEQLPEADASCMDLTEHAPSDRASSHSIEAIRTHSPEPPSSAPNSKPVKVSSSNIPSNKVGVIQNNLKARAMSWHEDSVQCIFCLRRVLKTDIKDHTATCELRTEPCRFGCRARVLAIKMEKHFENCPNNPLNRNEIKIEEKEKDILSGPS